MSSVITILKTVDGVEQAQATLTVSFGEVVDESKKDPNTILVGMGVEGLERYFKQALYERSGKMKFEQFEEMLDEYFKMRLSREIGVTSVPLKRNRDGVLEGVKDGVKVEVE